MTELIGLLVTSIVGPLVVGWCTRRWSQADRRLADEVAAQLRRELLLERSYSSSLEARLSEGAAPSSGLAE